MIQISKQVSAQPNIRSRVQTYDHALAQSGLIQVYQQVSDQVRNLIYIQVVVDEKARSS